MPKFNGPKWRTFRALSFVITGFSCLAPIIHGIMLYGFHDMIVHRGMMYWIGEGLVFLLGAFFYVVSFYFYLSLAPPLEISKEPSLPINQSNVILKTTKQTQIPESLAPGKFNYLGNSHQLFHILVVIGTVVHLAGLKTVFEHNYKRSCVVS